MPAVLICPQPGCRSENTGRFCNRCGADLTQINCRGCGKAYPEDLLAGPDAICEECGTGLAPYQFLLAPPGFPTAEPGAFVADERFRVHRHLGKGQYLAFDCKPNLKRLTVAIAEGSLAASYRKLSHLAGMPTVQDVVPDAAGDFLVLNGPIDKEGNLFPPLTDRWPLVSTQRRLAWLSAWTRLTIAFTTEGWSSSALDFENLRVSPEGQICIRALLPDGHGAPPAERLADLWLELFGRPDSADPAIPAMARRLKAGEMGLVDVDRELLKHRSGARVEVRHSGNTDTGRKRENNEDSFLGWQAVLHEVKPEGPAVSVRGLFAVCDGMGGHDRGEVASRTAVQLLQATILPELLLEDPGDGDLAARLCKLVREDVNSAILARNGGDSDGPFRRMGTTVVTVALVDDRAYWVHVGDSRIYCVTRDRVEQLTEDHNVGTRDVKMGVATMLEAFRSPVGKHLTQALGPRSGEFVHPDAGVVELDEPCVLLLCSDGLADMVPENDLHKIMLRLWDDPVAAVAELINQANQGGGLDNITAMAIRVEPTLPMFPSRNLAPQTSTASL